MSDSREPEALASRRLPQETTLDDRIASPNRYCVNGIVSGDTYNGGENISLEEKARIARQKGILCVTCGIKTHGIGANLKRVPFSDDYVHKGNCIKCDPSRVPEEILQRYQRKVALKIISTTDEGSPSDPKADEHSQGGSQGGSHGGSHGGSYGGSHGGSQGWSWAKDSFAEDLPSFQLVDGELAADENRSTTTSWSVCSRIEQPSPCSDDERSVLTWEEFTIASEDPSLWAITYEQLLTVYYEAKERYGKRFDEITMRDINQDMIIPLCDDFDTSYALKQNPAGLRVDAFVSHNWDGPFADFVDSIRKVFQCNAKKPNLWICAFALIQGNTAATKAQIGTDDAFVGNCPFVMALKAAKKFVVVRNRNGDLYSRIWCVCELIFANKLGFVPDSTFITGPDCFSNLKTSCIDAQATSIEDRTKILKVLLDESDYKEIDFFVNQFRCQDSPE